MSARIASYPMYVFPQTTAAMDRFWTLIRDGYGGGDPELTEFADAWDAWGHPDLLLSQTCGLPYRYALSDKVNLVGTLDYGVRGCPPGYYKSHLLVRKDDPRRALRDYLDTPFARNAALSQSGWAAIETYLAETMAGFRFRHDILETGSHAASVRAVATGQAGLASIDAVTWRFLKRYDPNAATLRVLLSTRPSPGLPLITGRNVDPEPLFHAISGAIERLTMRDRRLLAIKGITRIPAEAYLTEQLPFPLTPAP